MPAPTVAVPPAATPAPAPVPAPPPEPLTPLARLLQAATPQPSPAQVAMDAGTPLGKLFGTRQLPTAPPAAPAPADTSLQPLALLDSGYQALRAGMFATGASSNARNLAVM